MRGSKRELRPGVWELRVYLGRDHRGTERQRSRTFHGGPRAADRALAELVAEAGPAPAGDTLAALVAEWLDQLTGDRSPTTIKGYRSNAELHLLPELGARKLAKLTPVDFDRLYRKMAAAGKAPGTIRQVHAVARGALEQAVRWGWLEQNPAGKASPPKVRRQEVEPPTLDLLLALLADADPDLGALLMVAAATGGRRGELCGLQWRDVEGTTLRVRRAVIEATRGRLEVKDTKTHQERRVTMDPVTAGLLERHRALVDERARTAQVKVGRRGFIFSREADCSEPLRPEWVTAAWQRLCKRNGVTGVRLHDLRHLNASLLLASGVSIGTVSRRLGHAMTSTTLDIYGHMLPGEDEAAAAVMGELLRGEAPVAPGA